MFTKVTESVKQFYMILIGLRNISRLTQNRNSQRAVGVRLHGGGPVRINVPRTSSTISSNGANDINRGNLPVTNSFGGNTFQWRKKHAGVVMQVFEIDPTSASGKQLMLTFLGMIHYIF